MQQAPVTRKKASRDLTPHARQAACLLKAMANEYRLLILCHLAEGELPVKAINERLDLSQSSLSQHLGVLRHYGLVDTRRESQTIYYRLADGPAVFIMQTLYDRYCSAEGEKTASRPIDPRHGPHAVSVAPLGHETAGDPE